MALFPCGSGVNDTGKQDIYYGSSKVGWYRKKGNVVEVSIQTGTAITFGATAVALDTKLPSDCLPSETLATIGAIGPNSDKFGSMWILSSGASNDGMIQLYNRSGQSNLQYFIGHTTFIV